LHSPPHHRALPSFPTRRSSDLTIPQSRDGPPRIRSIDRRPSPYPSPRKRGEGISGRMHRPALSFRSERDSSFIPHPSSFPTPFRSEEHTSELQSLTNLVFRLLL